MLNIMFFNTAFMAVVIYYMYRILVPNVNQFNLKSKSSKRTSLDPYYKYRVSFKVSFHSTFTHDSAPATVYFTTRQLLSRFEFEMTC